MLRRVASAVVAVVAGLVGAVWVSPQPVRADSFVYLSVTLDISATFNFGGSNSGVLRAIEQAKRQIIAEIDASEARILAHIDGTEAGHIATCVRGSNQRLRGMDNPELQNDYGERINQANYASDCANQAGEMSRRVATLEVADYLGYAMAEANAIATVLRAWAGLDLESQLIGYIADYERLIAKLTPPETTSFGPAPRCVTWWQYADPNGWFDDLYYQCWAYNGDFAGGSRSYWAGNGGAESAAVGPPIDYEGVRSAATRNTSRRVAQEALPVLRRSLAMVQRDFVVAAAGDYVLRDGTVDRGQVRYWHEDGPLSWIRLGNPGTATAIAAATDPGDRRHYVAVIDGQVHHRIRNRDGGWTPWEPLPHGGRATEVTVAVHPDGRAEVAAVIDGQIHHRIRTSETAWTPWASLGNPGTVTALGSAIFGGGFHLAAVVDGQVRKNIRSADGSWVGWEDLGHGGTATSVAAVADPQGVFQLAAVIDGQFHHRGWYSGSGWTAWATPGANPGRATEVSGAVDPAGNAQWVVAVVLNGRRDVFLRTRVPSSWSAEWVRMGIDVDTFVNISGLAAS